MRTFHQKALLSYLVLLGLFLALTFLLVSESVQQIVFRSMSDRADDLIEKMQTAQNDEELIEILKDQKYLLFYRIGILDDKQRLLYDSHTKRFLGATQFPMEAASSAEVQEALRTGIGYAEEHSQLLGQKLIYLAKPFLFQGKRYVIRLAFPYHYIQELRKKLEIGFILFSSLILILFSITGGLILKKLTSPITKIIAAIKPYQQGNSAIIPEIQLATGPHDDFTHLANTLNSLSAKITSQINTLTHERNEKEAILESLAEGVLAVDENFFISYANAMALRILELDTNALDRLFPSQKHQLCAALLLKCQEENKILNDDIEMMKNGKKMHLNVVACPQGKGAILVLQDTSIHYKVLEMQKEFIANASHELKTPITIIRGFAETLQEHPELPKETIADITSKIVRNCQRMTKIVKNLLTLTHIEDLPHSRLGTCSLIELANSCKNTLLSLWPQANISISHDPNHSFELTADPELVEVALMNLLDNAAKYSKETPEITVVLDKLTDQTSISVIDSGIGIPFNELEHIFQRFYRVNKPHSKNKPHSTNLGGSGLGLSIVETIVKKHFGRVHVESTPGKGSSFTLFFPDDLENKLKTKNL